MLLMNTFEKYLYPLLTVVVVFMGAVRAEAAERKVIPSVAVREEFNDNIFMTASGEMDDFITTISPGIEYVERTERSDARVKGVIDAIAYSDNNELNAVDHDYSGRFRYFLTPILNVSADAGYKKDSRVDRDFSTTGLVLGTATREREQYGLGGEWTFIEKAKASLSYGYNEDDYDDPQFNDYYSHLANLGLTYDLSTHFPSTVGQMNFGYGHYEFTGSSIDNYGLTIGATKALSEIWSLNVAAGPRFTRTEFLIAGREETDEDWGAMGQVALSYQGEVTHADLVFSNDVQPATGDRSTTERTAVKLNINRRFSEELRGSLLAWYFRNKTESEVSAISNINEHNYRIQPRLHYAFTRDVTLEASYAYTFIDDKDDNIERERNLVFVKLLFQYPLFE